MKEFLVSIQQPQTLHALKGSQATGIIIADCRFSSAVTDYGITREAISEIKKLGFEAVVRLDRLYEEEELDDLEEYLRHLVDIGADRIIYTDLGVHVLMERNQLRMKGIYAPETLLTSANDIASLRKDGIDSCVISKDIPLRDVYAIMNRLPQYCLVRVHGPILIACSRRLYINAYLETDGKEYTDHYYLQEETRTDRLPIVEKETGSWLYGPCLQSLGEIGYLLVQPCRGVIIDNAMYDDEYTLSVMKLYDHVLNGFMTPEEAYRQLQYLDTDIRYLDINELKETWLEKEKA